MVTKSTLKNNQSSENTNKAPLDNLGCLIINRQSKTALLSLLLHPEIQIILNIIIDNKLRNCRAAINTITFKIQCVRCIVFYIFHPYFNITIGAYRCITAFIVCIYFKCNVCIDGCGAIVCIKITSEI